MCIRDSLSSSWKVVYEAEDGQLSGNASIADETGNACSGKKKVHFVDSANDKVTLTVQVPSDGYCLLYTSRCV